MKTLKFILSMAFILAIGAMFSIAVGVPVVAGGAALVGISMIPTIPAGALGAGLTPEAWHTFIEENQFRDAAFVKNSYDASEYVLVGKVVHIPNAGVGIGGARNRSKLPATVTQRKDIDVNYSLDEFTTDPTFIPDAETVELSYNKMDSVLGEHLNFIDQLQGDWFAYLWSPKTNILKTTGENVSVEDSHGNIAGERKAFTIDDLRLAKKKLNKQTVSKVDRFGLLDTEMMAQLENSLSANESKDFSRVYDPILGEIVKLEGFTLIERPLVSVYNDERTEPVVPFNETDSGRIKYSDYTAGANAAALFWQKNAVEHAVGEIKMFDETGSPVYYGDIVSTLQRMGGRIRRDDENGIIAVVQDVAGA